MALSADTLRWFADRRGLAKETLEAFGFDSEGEGVSIPYPSGAVKHRATLEKVDGKHRMWFDPKPPRGQPPFLPPNFSSAGKTKIVFEGETDSMAAWQAAPSEVKPHIVGMSGSNALGPRGWSDETIQTVCGDADRVFFVLDNEDPYTLADKSVESGKKQIKDKLGTKAKFVRLPLGPQDACEFFQTYDWAAFHELMLQALEVTYHFTYLDLTGPLPEYDWLVKDFLVKGDIGLLIGDGGVGKSWITFDLAVHMAMQKPKWLGMDLHGTKVMILDQENPLVTARRRLHQLGLRDEHAPNIKYAWYQSILLDQEVQVDRLMDDVAAFGPDLLVLDSLSRMHLKNENANEEMNPLINGAIYPIARNMGVTCMMIHHVSKAGGSRGATAIRNATDITLEMTDSEDGNWQIIRPDKLRSVAPWGGSLYTRRAEDDKGNVRLETEEEVTII